MALGLHMCAIGGKIACISMGVLMYGNSISIAIMYKYKYSYILINVWQLKKYDYIGYQHNVLDIIMHDSFHAIVLILLVS